MAYPAVGTLSYNGYEFTGERHVTIEQRAEYDEAGRTVAILIVRLRVEAKITSSGGGNTNNTLDEIRHTLSQPGGILLYSGDGFGELNVNTGGNNDMRWGPKPQMLSWRPEGSARACEIVWELECAVSACDSPGGLLGQANLYEFNYGVSFSCDKHGAVTRTVKGHLKVCQSRIPGKRIVTRTADDYVGLIQLLAPPGFTRTFDREISLDKSRLDFTVVDQQIRSRNPYPPKCIEISGTQEVHWSRRPAASSFRVTMDMEITLESGTPGEVAWNIFVGIVRQRMLIARRNGLIVLLDSIGIREDLFGESAGFHAGFRIISDDTKEIFSKMVRGTGLFSSLQTDWNVWRASLSESMFSAFGTAGLKLNATDDQLVDACGGRFVLTLPSGSPILYLPKGPGYGQKAMNVKPPPEKSYVYYISALEPSIKYPTSVHSPLQKAKSETATITGVDFTKPESARPATPPFSVAPLGGEALQNSIHTRGGPTNTIRYKGSAVRAGYPVPKPTLNSVGDQPATVVDEDFKITQMPNLFGVPIYGAAWDITYVLPSPPQNLTPPPPITDVA